MNNEVKAQHESYWIESCPINPYPTLEQNTKTQVVVIGAGIAGISTAWELTQRGFKVILLEAGRVASGVTGYTTAKISALQGTIYTQIIEKLGPNAAQTYADSQLFGLERIEAITNDLDIDCSFERVPSVTYVSQTDNRPEIKAEHTAARTAGLQAEFDTAYHLPYPVSSAIRVEDQAQFHPRKYLKALLEDMSAKGALIFEEARVADLKEGPVCEVTLTSGIKVQAEHVVVATHYPIFDRAGLFGRLTPKRESAIAALIPIGDDPIGAFITSEENTRSIRTAPFNDTHRLLIVTGEHFTPGEASSSEAYETLTKWTKEKFPQADVRYYWSTQDNTSSDMVPFIGKLHPGVKNVYVLTGFGGWGMANGALGGFMLAKRIEGETTPWDALFDTTRLHASELPEMFKLQTKAFKSLVFERLKPHGKIQGLELGEGKVVRMGVKHCAVYREMDGSLKAVSAACTHLGCLVGFNDAEKTWDCPCHGSRFSTSGEVIQGPATKPLKGVEI